MTESIPDQSIDDFHLRPAQADDWPVCVELWRLAAAQELQRDYSHLRRGLSIENVLAALCRSSKGPYSWRHFTLAIHEGVTFGGYSLVPGDDIRRLSREVPHILVSKCGVKLPGLLKLLTRALVPAFSPRIRIPVESVCLQAGGVLPAYRKKKIATQALPLCFDEARRAGFKAVYLYVSVNNAAAISLFQSLGFHMSPPNPSAKYHLMYAAL